MIIPKSQDLALIKENLHNNGFSFLPVSLSLSECESIKHFIDSYPDNGAEINYEGTEKRVWGAQAHNSVVKEYARFSDKFLTQLFGRQAKSKTTLAYRNLPVHPESLKNKGRWHLDSFREQYKLFVFLTKTTEESGPFEFLSGTHKMSFKLKALLSGKVMKLSDFGSKKRTYQSLDEKWVEYISQSGYDPTPVLCEAGKVLVVNTSTIHRARPCISGNRYAVATYYNHF